MWHRRRWRVRWGRVGGCWGDGANEEALARRGGEGRPGQDPPDVEVAEAVPHHPDLAGLARRVVVTHCGRRRLRKTRG